MHAPAQLYSDDMTMGSRLLCCWLWCHVDLARPPCVDVPTRRMLLRKHLGVSRTTLQRYLEDLESWGWIQLIDTSEISGHPRYGITIRLFFAPAVRQQQQVVGGS